MSPPAPERVLRLSLIGWGLGELAMGRRRAGFALMAMEAIALAAVFVATVLWADTTWYLLPFLLGVGFLVAWTAQAVLAYGRARRGQPASPSARPRSPAAIVAWMTLPLLAWGTGFWLIGANASSPASVVDEFVTRWASLDAVAPPPFDRHDESPMIEQEAGEALYSLQQLCEQAVLTPDCSVATKNLLRDVRVSIEPLGELEASAVAHLVEYRQRATTVLGVLQGSEIQPVPIRTVLTLGLESQPATWGARRWVIVNAAAQ